MSARLIIVLALVAYVAVQANSFPSGVKGGQSYVAQQPLKSSYPTQQQWQQPSKYFGQPTYKQEPVVGQQSQSSVSAPAQVQIGAAMVESPPLQQERPIEAAPTTQSVAPAQLSEPVPVKSAPAKGQTTYLQEQRFEPVPVAGQSVAPAQLSAVSPAKGQTFYPQEQRQEVATPVVAQTVQIKSVEPAPVKGVPVKGQMSYQQEQRFEAAPAQVSEVVPTKAQSLNQQEQRHEVATPLVPLATKTTYEPVPFKGVAQGQTSYPQEQRVEVAPVFKSPQSTAVPQHHENAPVKGQALYQQAQRFPTKSTAKGSPVKGAPVKRAPVS